MKFLSMLLALSFSLSTLSGCGPVATQSGVKEVKVAFWGSPEEIDIITTSIKGWQDENPDIKIIFEHTPYTGYDSKILTRIAGGAAPDIIATEVDYFVTFATKNVLENLEPFIEGDEEFSKEAFLRDYLDSQRMLVRLNQVMNRVKLQPLPAETISVLNTGRKIVEERLNDLLPPEHF